MPPELPRGLGQIGSPSRRRNPGTAGCEADEARSGGEPGNGTLDELPVGEGSGAGSHAPMIQRNLSYVMRI